MSDKLYYINNPNLKSTYANICTSEKIKPTQRFNGDNKYAEIENEKSASQLSYYKMTEEEEKVWKELCEKVHLYLAELQIPGEYEAVISERLKTNIYYTKNCGYHKEHGYYYVEFGDRGSLHLLLLSGDINDALWCLLERIIDEISMRESQKNKRINESGWKCNTKFDYRKYWFEYEIKALSKIVDSEFLKDYINNRLHSMNWWFNPLHWGFDCKRMEFVEVSDSVERDTLEGDDGYNTKL
ncbi:hypothetical protein [Anaerocolumna xylanovorans]|uniref:Immunity protein 63 n=1 Tax=Anaerocolumna xylanovorans DSM 12503 TaxID=1121345 RepID=A0A1M7Y7W4_9FIRM|nr:hypothetical protein [Anaerocolumna xylanovorans]SHO48709.1 hypothetical protein SAMN02745217_01988 [Anaerocolumna xylanovorans DSM 12503]